MLQSAKVVKNRLWGTAIANAVTRRVINNKMLQFAKNADTNGKHTGSFLLYEMLIIILLQFCSRRWNNRREPK